MNAYRLLVASKEHLDFLVEVERRVSEQFPPG
jgi:hypothetical protein